MRFLEAIGLEMARRLLSCGVEAVQLQHRQIAAAYLEEMKRSGLLIDQNEADAEIVSTSSGDITGQQGSTPAIVVQEEGEDADLRRSARTRDPNRVLQPDFIYH